MIILIAIMAVVSYLLGIAQDFYIRINHPDTNPRARLEVGSIGVITLWDIHFSLGLIFLCVILVWAVICYWVDNDYF